ncbi:MAG: hypothetical protein AB4042_14025 [Leptolyngbyaceae cyanobacterium]
MRQANEKAIATLDSRGTLVYLYFTAHTGIKAIALTSAVTGRREKTNHPKMH